MLLGLLGLHDPWISLVYALCILSSLLCVVYGLANWNRGDEPISKEDQDWAKKEKAELEQAL